MSASPPVQPTLFFNPKPRLIFDDISIKNAFAVDKTARPQITAAAPPAAKPLVALPQWYDFKKGLEDARLYVQEGKKKEAKAKYLEILSHEQKPEKGVSLSFFFATCELELALLFPAGSVGSKRHANQAYERLNIIFAARNGWSQCLYPNICVGNFRTLQRMYEKLIPLLPDRAEESWRKIAECSKQIAKIDKKSPFFDTCEVELAFLFPEGSPERAAHATEAKYQLDSLYDKRKAWSRLLEKDVVLKNYKLLREKYEKLRVLLPYFDAEFQAKIAECSKHIPLLDNFKDEVSIADKLAKVDIEKARDRYSNALRWIEDQDTLPFQLACADGQLKLALAYPEGDTKAAHAQKAKDLILPLAPTEEKDKLFLGELLEKLLPLFENNPPALEEIKTKLKTYPRKVEPSKYATLAWRVLGGLVDVLVVAGAFMLIRRYIFKIK